MGADLSALSPTLPPSLPLSLPLVQESPGRHREQHGASASSGGESAAAAETPSRVGVLFEYAVLAPGQKGPSKQTDGGISFGGISVVLPSSLSLPPLPPLPPKVLEPQEGDPEDDELRTEL